MSVTTRDVGDAGPLADVIISVFDHYTGRPSVACAALAIVLGQAAARFGVSVDDVETVLRESARLAGTEEFARAAS